MREVLEVIRALLEKHQDLVSLDVVDRLLSLHRRDQPKFWEEIRGLEVWGGAGSLADQGLSIVRSPAQSDLQTDRRILWSQLAAVEEQMEQHGSSTPRARQWAEVFRGWIRAGA